MRNKTPWIFLLLLLLGGSLGCRRSITFKNPARITSDHVEIKKTRAALSSVVAQLNRGDEVDVLARESHWLRIRTKEGKIGWIEASDALNQSIVDAENQVAAETKNEIIQAVGELSAMSNLHTKPGRDTPVFKRLPRGEKLQIYDRTLTDRPGVSPAESEATPVAGAPLRQDPWLKVRTANGHAGWVYSPSVTFDVPDEIAENAESRRIVAWQVLNQVTLADGKKMNQYVIGDVEPGIAPEYDFDRIRVFTWSQRHSRYETAFRENKILGMYPIRVFTVDNKPAFEISRLSSPDWNAPRITEQYVMNGVLVRRLEAAGAPHPKPAPRSRRRR